MRVKDTPKVEVSILLTPVCFVEIACGTSGAPGTKTCCLQVLQFLAFRPWPFWPGSMCLSARRPIASERLEDEEMRNDESKAGDASSPAPEISDPFLSAAP